MMDWGFFTVAFGGLAIVLGLYVNHEFTERRWAREKEEAARSTSTPAE